MRRLRFAMLALGVALSIPVALLIALALESVALEEATRHQTLAARAFDEMERALSGFLEEEESRPIDHYAYFMDPGEAGSRTRSPLSRLSDRPFLVGHFQIDPQGTLSTPLQPRPGEDKENATKDLAPSTLEAIATLERLVPDSLAGGMQNEEEKKAAVRAFGYGATITLEQPTTPVDRFAKRLGGLLQDDAPTTPSEEVTTALDTADAVLAVTGSSRNQATIDPQSLSLDEALESLNVAQKLRQQRVQKRSVSSELAAQLESLGYLLGDAEALDRDVTSSLQSAPRRGNRALEGAVLQEVVARADAPGRDGEDNTPISLAGRMRARSSASPLPTGKGEASADDVHNAREVPEVRQARDVREARKAKQDRSEREAEFDARSYSKSAAERPATPPANARLPAATAAPRNRLERQPVVPTPTPSRIEIDPMLGQRVDEKHLLLSRTVLVGTQGYRQGMLIEREKLGEWLNDRVISGSRLAEVSQLRFADDGDRYGVTELGGDSYLYRHHFAEPFDALTATLALQPLAGAASARNIYALSGLLAVIAAGGLFAVYRMIAVVVRYAERRSAFVSAVSHELKTPLTAIRMYGEMLRDGLVSSEEKRNEYYSTIHDESERLGRLINNVLEFSQLERGQRELHLVAGSVGEVVREVVSNLAPHAERQGFTLSARVDDDLPAVRFDRDALIQVLFNLADNAMKYARGAGPPRIEIGCHRADERGRRSPSGQRVVLEVRDFGPGVARRHLSHLFEPFYRATASNEVAKGTGIGLALVRDLCEAMGAGVTASNVAEGGFRVLVDFHAAEA